MIAAPAFIRQCQSNQFEIKPITLIYGEEPLYIRRALDGLRDKLKSQDYLQRDRFDVDASFKWDELRMEISAGSLFADRRIIELEVPSAKFGRDGGAFIQEWLKLVHDVPPEICLVILCEKIEYKQKSAKWFKAIEESGWVVESKPILGQNLTAWCQNKASELGLSLELEAANLLAERVEGNLLAADQELEKLALLFPKQAINVGQIQYSVADQAHYQLFALSSAMLNGRTQLALQILHRLAQTGLEQPVILWLLSKELRELINLSQLQQTQSLEAVFKRLRIWQSKQAEYRSALQRHNLSELQSLLSIALAVDLNMKGLRAGYSKQNAWVSLSELVFKIAS